MVGWWRQGIGPRGTLLAAAVAVALPATLLLAMHLVRKTSRARHFFVDTKAVEFAVADAARDTGSPVLRLAAAVFVLFRREAFTPPFRSSRSRPDGAASTPCWSPPRLSFVLLTLIFYVKPIEEAMRGRFAALAALYAR